MESHRAAPQVSQRKGEEIRKRPRPGDLDVAPAPDAPSSVPAVTSEEEKGGGTVSTVSTVSCLYS